MAVFGLFGLDFSGVIIDEPKLIFKLVILLVFIIATIILLKKSTSEKKREAGKKADLILDAKNEIPLVKEMKAKPKMEKKPEPLQKSNPHPIERAPKPVLEPDKKTVKKLVKKPVKVVKKILSKQKQLTLVEKPKSNPAVRAPERKGDKLFSKEPSTPQQYFYLSDGSALKSINDLIKSLDKMPDDIFSNYVSKDFNHFASWIGGVFQIKDLANKLRKVYSKKNTIKILKEY
ncbi:hypothetical protein ACFLTH_09420 [Bacteroidota bacterium]